ncbi:carbohydrate-binding family 9-like protein [Marinilabilia rubra]|uniref:Carbohydrate-binding family 9-like protein n=1 Tax=Marinilabilia rubra TaxID=2162893 RepID=A0A2U2BCU5_9BACT|nr:carbohydrate-binding family 9-like protein [Marinilabilia rubra]PWE00888.1 carbohydrate-binding family 9-like protein [Marinilabilia rubra]
MKPILLTFLLAGILQSPFAQSAKENKFWEQEDVVPVFNPSVYVCYRSEDPIIVDGKLNEESWKNVPWTDEFQDIRGKDFAAPAYSTKAKMVWDDEYFYVAAKLEEPHVQGKITEHDAVIFHDNDFEVFIDPDGDSHLYYEFEMNARNTIWDLLLVKPYRDGGPPVNSLETPGIRTAVHIEGSLNDPSDEDEYWSVEIAFPISVLEQISRGHAPGDGAYWRVNFSRVQWHTEVIDGHYLKQKDPQTGKHLPEENWVWSPQGVVNMHRPETWGFVFFTNVIAGKGAVDFNYPRSENIKWGLRNLYYAQKAYRAKYGQYASKVKKLTKIGFKPESLGCNVEVKAGWHTFEAKAVSEERNWFIDQEGHTWSVKK